MQSSTLINRRHSIDSSYFDNIDTQEKAYWLGFIWADGCISKTGPRGSGPNRLRLAQKWSEKEHLEKFQKALKSDYEIKPVEHDNGHTVAQLDINCRPLCEALQNLGYDIKPKRCHIPPIPRSLLPHFIRGYFDGDGALSIYTQTIKKWVVLKQEWSITGNIQFVSEVKDELTKSANVTKDVALKYYKRSPTVATVRYGKRADISLLYDYLYKNASVYLETKHNKFVEFFSRFAS